MEHVVCKVQIVPGKCTADIIIHLLPAVRKLLELGDNQVIAAAAVTEGAHLIVDILSSVQAQHHIAHLAVAEFHHLVI